VFLSFVFLFSLSLCYLRLAYSCYVPSRSPASLALRVASRLCFIFLPPPSSLLSRLGFSGFLALHSIDSIERHSEYTPVVGVKKEVGTRERRSASGRDRDRDRLEVEIDGYYPTSRFVWRKSQIYSFRLNTDLNSQSLSNVISHLHACVDRPKKKNEEVSSRVSPIPSLPPFSQPFQKHKSTKIQHKLTFGELGFFSTKYPIIISLAKTPPSTPNTFPNTSPSNSTAKPALLGSLTRRSS